MSASPNLALPFIEAAQSQKHVTHNEALRLLDTLVQLAVLDRASSVPPSAPAEGQRWIVAANPSGAWSAHAGHVAAWQDGAWVFAVPQPGWLAYNQAARELLAWNGSAWIGALAAFQNLPTLGVNTAADAGNRLAVKADGVLFSQDDVTPGSGNMRVTVNKKAAANDAGFVFQDGYSTRALVGLLADDSFHVKVSPDGAAFYDAMVVAPAGGSVSFLKAPSFPSPPAGDNGPNAATTAWVRGYLASVGTGATAPVQSVNGRTGAVTLAAADVGLGNVSNTADADKPVSSAQAAALAGKLNKAGDALTGALNFAPAIVLAAAATLDLGAQNANRVVLTGTAGPVTSFGTAPDGTWRRVRFQDAGLVLVAGVNLMLPGGANITTGAGDDAEFTSQGGGAWRCNRYNRADGTAVVGSAGGAGAATTGPTLKDFRWVLTQLAKLSGTVLNLDGTVDDDFKDQTGVNTAASISASYDGPNNLIFTTPGGVETAQSLPAMTSNTAPSGHVASASSAYSGQPAFLAFDQSTSFTYANAWSSTTTNPGEWVARQTPSAIRVGSYAIRARNDSGAQIQNPSAWVFEGSNDGTTWAALDTQSGQSWTAGERKAFTIPAASRGSYNRHRVRCTAGGSTVFTIVELELLQEVSGGDLDLRSIAFTANTAPAKASIYLVAKPLSGATAPNSNLLAKASRDGGTTWSTFALARTGTLSGGLEIYEANNLDISGQPSGTAMLWRVQAPGLQAQIHAVVFSWG